MKKNKVWLTDEQKALLKASEITEIRKEQDAYGGLGALLILTIFLFALSVVALVLWFGKLTIFISSGLLLMNILVLFLAYVQFNSYKESIIKAKKRIEAENISQ